MNFATWGSIMPLFDFDCRACGHRFEALVRHDAPVCPACQSRDLEKLLSSFAVSTPERWEAAAAASTKKAADTAARDNAARERAAQRHRLEDH